MLFLLIVFLSGLFISSVAAYFSIAGMLAIFPGAPTAIVCMGAALEVGKLVTASWIYRYWKQSAFLIKTYFILAVCILSFVTSVGIFGYLSKAHIEGTRGLATGSDQISSVDGQISTEKQAVEFNNRVLAQMDGTVTALLSDTARIERALAVRNSQKRERQKAIADIASSNKTILGLQQKKDSLSVTQRDMEVDVGPIKYLAALWYETADTTNMERMVRFLIVLLIFVFDPLAVLLLVAANIHLREMGKKTLPPPIPAFPRPTPEVKPIPTETLRKEWQEIANTRHNPAIKNLIESTETYSTTTVPPTTTTVPPTTATSQPPTTTTKTYYDHTQPEKFGQSST